MTFFLLFYLPMFCWAGWEFARRYTGPRPRWYALGLKAPPLVYPLFPLAGAGMGASIGLLAFVAWSVAMFYRLFATYPLGVPKPRRRVNGFALIYALGMLLIPIACAASLLILISFMLWSRRDEVVWMALAIGVPSFLMVSSLIFVTAWSYQRSALRQETA